jgi:beta-phosphoglucomutase family hydrolase
MSKQLSAVIFDMDGTLVDSMPYHHQAWVSFLSQKGIDLSPEEVHEKIHGTAFDIMPRFFGAHITPQQSMALALEKEALYMQLYTPHIAPLPGLTDWLQVLRTAGIKIALATAADEGNTQFTLQATGIGHFFDALVTSNEVPEGKPSPAVFLRAAQKLGVPPAACFAFEDTYSGVEAALAAGMQVAAITTMHPPHAWAGKGVAATLPDYTKATLPWLQSFFT